MHILVRAVSAQNHMRAVLGARKNVVFMADPAVLSASRPATLPTLVLVHANSFSDDLNELLGTLSARPGTTLGIASDAPNLTEFLRLSRFAPAAYFNSHMADVHYAQMLDMLAAGQSWFPPGLLARALAAARNAVLPETDGDLLKLLTRRERQVAIDVAAGLSNKDIAERREISERTVKTHLTRVFRKLGVSGRLELAVLLRTGRASDVEPGETTEA